MSGTTAQFFSFFPNLLLKSEVEATESNQVCKNKCCCLHMTPLHLDDLSHILLLSSLTSAGTWLPVTAWSARTTWSKWQTSASAGWWLATPTRLTPGPSSPSSGRPLRVWPTTSSPSSRTSGVRLWSQRWSHLPGQELWILTWILALLSLSFLCSVWRAAVGDRDLWHVALPWHRPLSGVRAAGEGLPHGPTGGLPGESLRAHDRLWVTAASDWGSCLICSLSIKPLTTNQLNWQR